MQCPAAFLDSKLNISVIDLSTKNTVYLSFVVPEYKRTNRIKHFPRVH